MIFWFPQVALYIPSLYEVKQEIFNFNHLEKLDSIYYLCWEEFVHDTPRDLKCSNGWPELAETINEISHRAGKDIPFYIVTAANSKYSEQPFDSTDALYRNVKIIYIPVFLFLRTQYRLGKDISTKNPWTEENAQVYYHNLNVAGVDITDPYTGLNTDNYRYTYIYTVLYPKPHRCTVMDNLARFDLIDKGAIAWREFNRNLDRSTIPQDRVDSQSPVANVPYKWRWWTPKRLYLDQPADTPGPINFDWVPEQYSQSFMAIIGESLEDRPFITEKTVVPLMYNKPFLSAASAYFHKNLSDMGFELYTELFDYSFDRIEHTALRITELVKQVQLLDQKIKEQGYKKLLDSIREKLIYNKQRAHDITLDSSYVPKEVLDFYDNQHFTHRHLDYRLNNVKNTYPYFDYAKKFNQEILGKK